MRKQFSDDYIIDAETGCWVWQKTLRSGYGRAKRDGRLVTAHRWYWESANGPVPEGLELDHLCRNRACVNPEHLEPVTRNVNIRRGLSAKLTPQLVAEIKAQPYESVAGLARWYGVSKAMINKIRSGAHWGDIATNHPKRVALGTPAKTRGVHELTEAEVAEIRTAPRHYGSGRELAHKYGVSDGAINAVRAKDTS